ncbi:MAG: flagellar assembly protein FliH [Treponema sp.]|jgi:flagellar assembly protein FliH|nr:flagellar assembly protein FliH [Treponema sp.]
MAKMVFRPGELAVSNARVLLDPPDIYEGHPRSPEPPEEKTLVERYTGPTAEDLRREAEAFKLEWEKGKESMIQSAQAEAETILKEAEAKARQELDSRTAEAAALQESAQAEAARMVAEAKAQAVELETTSRDSFEKEKQAAQEAGQSAGRDAGYLEGKAEVERLIERTRTVLERAQGQRAEILSNAEGQVIDLVLLLARKVVKVIAENQEEVIIANVTEALRKVKSRGTIIIRVNTSDLKLTTNHTKEFISLVEGADTIQVQEDSTVGQGGCVIETDFGEIDARISSQLAELEDKILVIAPIRKKGA